MKKIGLLCLALVLALGSLGFGYAMWYQDVIISGQVDTGYVCIQWTGGNNPDPCGYFSLDAVAPGDPYYPEGTLRKDKDVGCTEVLGYGTKTLTVTINEAYPSYYIDLEVEYENCGTIPVIVTGVDIVPDNFTRASGLYENDGEVWIGWANGVGHELNPGDDPVGSSLKIHLEQMAEQDATYTFTITIHAVQFNEA
jgi:hypothetical protein